MKRTIELKVPLSLDMLPIITQITEQAGQAFGLSAHDIKRSVLGCEDLFSYLASRSDGISDLMVNISDCGYYIRIIFKFRPIPLPLQVLNITAVNDPGNPVCLAHMEIFIAAHIVDRFILDQDTRDETIIHLIIEKQYPEVTNYSLDVLPSSLKHLICKTGTHEEIKQATVRIIQTYGLHAPDFCRYPGKTIDMIRSGEMQAAVNCDEEGNVAGCVFWVLGEYLIEVYGPYPFVNGYQVAEELSRFLLESIGILGLKCLIIRHPTPGIPESWFEKIPSIFWNSDNNLRDDCFDSELPLYRHIEEDTGSFVVVHPVLTPVVSQWYDQMSLPRFLTSSLPAGEAPDEFTVFSVRIDNNRKITSLSMRTAGSDAAEVLDAHITHLSEQGITCMTYEMDLSNEMEVFLVPVLLKSGFSPSYIIPWGGTGDILVFHYMGGVR